MTYSNRQNHEYKNTITMNVLCPPTIENSITFQHCQSLEDRYNQDGLQELGSITILRYCFHIFQNHYQYHDFCSLYYRHTESNYEKQNISINVNDATVHNISKDLN